MSCTGVPVMIGRLVPWGSSAASGPNLRISSRVARIPANVERPNGPVRQRLAHEIGAQRQQDDAGRWAQPPPRGSRTQPAAPIDIAVHSDAICHLQQMAIKLRRKLRWDPAQGAFLDDEEANRLLDRPMRAPWTI